MSLLKSNLFVLGLVFTSTLLGFSAKPVSAETTTPLATTITIRDDVRQADVRRFGINLGAHDRYGASQLLKNLIINPGFEAGEQSMIFRVEANPTATQIQADFWDTSWNNDSYNIGQPVGHWDFAQYEVLTGASQGQVGQISRFDHSDQRYTFHLDRPISLASADLIAVRTIVPGYYGLTSTYNQPDTATTRPNSSGRQSLKLLPTNNYTPSYQYTWDTYYRDGDRAAGKLYLVRGAWRISLWAKAQKAGETLTLRFWRDGETVFFEETIALTTEWQQIVRTFSVADGSDPYQTYDPDPQVAHPALQFSLKLANASSPLWVDDLFLGRNDDPNPTAFSQELVNKLKELQPGLLRNWGDQLGSSLDNQLADPFGRKTTAYRPHDRLATMWHYSLPEFLQLCQAVGAEPWYVIPPTFTPQELDNLIAYLAAPVGTHAYADLRATLGQSAPWTELFPQIHLELGNETWGANRVNVDPFVGATFRGGTTAGLVSHGRFGVIRASVWYRPNQFNLIIGGQYGYPPTNLEIENSSQNHDTLALAPYFGQLDQWESDTALFYPLYAWARQEVQTGGKMRQSADALAKVGQNTQLAIYELNFHVTRGNPSLPTTVRNDLVTGVSGALILPFQMLTYLQEMGIRYQAMWKVAGFSTATDINQDGTKEYVRLFGGLRDLQATGRKRPTWLGLELVNQAVQGDLITTQHSGYVPTWTQTPINGITQSMTIPYLHSFAFRDGGRHTMVLFNLHLTESLWVNLQFPHTPPQTATLSYVLSKAIRNGNEDGNVVSLHTRTLPNFGQYPTLGLEPSSIYVLTWEENSVPSAVGLQSMIASSSAESPLLWLFTLLILLTLLTIGRNCVKIGA